MGVPPLAPYMGVPLQLLIWEPPPAPYMGMVPPAPYIGVPSDPLYGSFPLWSLIWEPPSGSLYGSSGPLYRSYPPAPSPPKSNSCYTMETNRIVSLWELVHFHLNLFSRWLVLMTDLCGCGRRLMNLCLWKKNESRFDLMSFFSVCFYLWVLSFECKINWILLFFRRERRSLKRVLHRTQSVW